MSPDPEPSQSKVSGSVWVVLAIAVLTFVFYPRNTNKGSNPTQPNLQQSNIKDKNSTITSGSLIAKNPAILGSHDRLALLESFSSLDSTVIDHCYGSVVLDPREFESEEKLKLAQKFQSEINSYQSLKELVSFSRAVGQLIKLEETPDDPALDAHLKKFRKLPGSDSILAGIRDSNLRAAFHHITNQRMDQLQSQKQIEDLTTVFKDHWYQQFKRQGIEVSFPKDLPAKNGAGIQGVLRHLELSSTRFLLAISGNEIINEHIKGVYPGEIGSAPIYFQALNAVLDPLQRRFRTIETYQPPLAAPDPNSNDLFEEIPDEQIALVEFTGAMPRAKLFSDWQQGVDKDTASDILYSPGFNPHAQILLRQAGLPKPERPAATVNLPDIKIESMAKNRVVLNTPALEHNTILLLNDPFAPSWIATVEGKSIAVLQANNDVRAIYLKSSAKSRTVVFSKTKSK
jgi:hypothetical protein